MSDNLDNTEQNFTYVIWKNSKHFTPEKNRRFRLGRISGEPDCCGRRKTEVFDAERREWTQTSGNYVIARAAKLKEIMECQK